MSKPEHSKKCDRTSFATGYDWRNCGQCSVEAAQELLALRAKVQK
jgi:hypothetical protein